MGGMIERVRENNNMFWDSARRLHLDAFLEALYRSGSKKAMLGEWLQGGEKKVLIHQKDFFSDPLLIVFRGDNAAIRVVENGERIEADVEIEATHTAIICCSTDFLPCLRAWLRREIIAPRLWSRMKDHFYAARIFLS
jgi:hypothetical protein